MAIAAVQRVIKGGIGTSVAIGAADTWAAPTSGNLLVLSANADITMATPTGAGTWTAGPSVVDGNGAYTWYKFATGTETTITFPTTAGSFNITATAAEYSGVSAFDVQNSSTIAGTSGTVTTAAAVSTTAAADLVVAFALLHSAGVGTPTSPSWTNSFVNVLTGSSSGSPTNSVAYTFAAELLPAGAAGSYSTVCSWTTAASDRQHIILAFKASGATAASLAFPRRPSRGLIMR